MKIERQCRISSENVSRASGAPPPVETVAAYFRDLARRGLGCCVANRSIASVTGLTIGQVVAAKRVLVDAGRLRGAWGVWLSIDGERFNTQPTDAIEAAKVVLRRVFPIVCDARVVDRPRIVPRGPATHLLVGERRLTVAQALDLAGRITAGGMA
jgi:hypothetical protein